MKKRKNITISFIGTTELKKWLDDEANRQDRSTSAVIRTILEKEKTNKENIKAAQQKENRQ